VFSEQRLDYRVLRRLVQRNHGLRPETLCTTEAESH
jgi:hypothetical protein